MRLKQHKSMIVRLIEPCTLTPNNNWMLSAEGLNDPMDWSRFHPVNGDSLERAKFERVVRTQGQSESLTLCKKLLRRGLCVFEYGWNMSIDAILEHAIAVAESFQLELVVGGNPLRPSTAA